MTIGQRIKEARKAKGLTQVDVAKHFGITRNAVSLWESDKNQPEADRVPLIAAFLNRSPNWLWTGKEEVSPVASKRASNSTSILLVGKIGAGAEVYPVDDHEKGAGLDDVEPPPGFYGTAVALRVEGDSMWPAYRQNDLIVYRRRGPDDWRRLVGQEVVVKLKDGRTLVKILKRATQTTAVLSSHNAPDIEGAKVEWAAPVLWVKRAGAG